MRKRSEEKQGWRVLLYKYRVYLKGEHRFFDLPESVQEEARRMRDYWNTLVRAADESSTRYQAILAESQAVEELTQHEAEAATQVEELWTAIKAIRKRERSVKSQEEALLKDRLTQAKERLKSARTDLKAARTSAKEEKREQIAAHRAEWDAYLRKERQTTAFHWGNREYLLDALKPALAKARKEGVALRTREGRFDRVHFRQPYTMGLPVSFMFSHQGRVRFAHGKSQHRLFGQFQAGTTLLDFDMVYHRPLPENGLIKFVDLVGEEYAKGGGKFNGAAYRSRKPLWEWHLVIAVEFPPAAIKATPQGVAAIDIGWRKRPDGSLRVAYLLDNDKHEQEISLPAAILRDFETTLILQQQMDRDTDETAEVIRNLLQGQSIEQELRSLLWAPHITRPKLFAAMRLLDTYPDAHAEAQRWAVRTTMLYWRQRNRLRYCMRYRDDFYRKQALALCQRYKTLVIEDMDLRTLRRKDTKEGKAALQFSEYLGRFANLSFFRRALIEAAVKTGSEIHKVPAAYTTIPCSACGEIVDNTGALTLTCSKGHSWDQDKNADENLLFAFHGPLPSSPEIGEFSTGA